MTGRNRGAAQVSVMWVIALCVILVFVVIFAYTSQQSAADWELAHQDAVADRQAALDRENATNEAHVTLSKNIGFVEGAQGTSAPNAVSAALGEAASVFGVPDAANIESLLPAATAAYQKALTEKRDLESTVAQLRSDLDARNAAHRTALSEKDSRINDLSSQLEDTTNSLNQRNFDLESQRDSLRQQVSDQDGQIAQLRSQLLDQARGFENEKEVQLQRAAILSERLNKVERRAAGPDGSVLAASASLKKAWIDRGRLDRIVPGMEFAVHHAETSALKGRIKVVNVEEKRPECTILATLNQFDPIGEDDEIRNAIYDPSRQPVAVLLGNGFGRLSATDMKNKLKEIGILVAEQVTNEADYLILGTPFFDEDTGEVVDWSSRSEYRLAEENALTIVPLRDAMAWLGL